MHSINLWGNQGFELDPSKKGIEARYFKRGLEECITSPTTTSEAKKGSENKERNIGHLTDPYLFEGYAWYAKELVILEEDLNKTIQLLLVCTAQLDELGESRPAKWLAESLVQYVQSEQFAPSKAITLKQLEELYTEEN